MAAAAAPATPALSAAMLAARAVRATRVVVRRPLCAAAAAATARTISVASVRVPSAAPATVLSSARVVPPALFRTFATAAATKDAPVDLTTLKVKAGDKFPNVDLFEGSPAGKVNTTELLSKAKKAIVFGVPGAFTPGCHKQHLPGYVNDFKKLEAKGVDLIVCVSVNDAFVMAAWGEASGATGKVRMLADPNAELAKALGLDKNIPPLGGVRCKRFSALVESGVVKQILPEPEGVPMACSTSINMLKFL